MPSAAPDALESRLALGLLAMLDEWSIVTWSEIADYSPGTVRPAYLGPADPAGAPDERVLITPRSAVMLRGKVVEIPVGFAWRGAVDADPLAATNWLGLLRRRFDRLPPTVFGGVPVGAVMHQSSGALGLDERRRPIASATYTFRTRMGSANR